MDNKIHLNEKDSESFSGSRLFNISALILCWIATLGGILYFAITSKPLPAIAILGFVPFRYFFFDLSSDRLTKRPPELDRAIPLQILLHYLSIRFPIPQGKFLADVAGVFLAVGRAFINGFGLLYFDTFAFAFKIRNDTNGTPLDEDIAILHDNEKLQRLAEEAQKTDSETRAAEYSKLKNDWEQTEITNELNQWNFPIRRYLNPTNPYFRIREIGNIPLDDQYSLDRKAFLKAHPNQQDYFGHTKKDEQEIQHSVNKKNESLSK